MSIQDLTQVLKHMAGKHNQSLHNPYKRGVGSQEQAFEAHNKQQAEQYMRQVAKKGHIELPSGDILGYQKNAFGNPVYTLRENPAGLDDPSDAQIIEHKSRSAMLEEVANSLDTNSRYEQFVDANSQAAPRQSSTPTKPSKPKVDAPKFQELVKADASRISSKLISSSKLNDYANLPSGSVLSKQGDWFFITASPTNAKVIAGPFKAQSVESEVGKHLESNPKYKKANQQ